MHLDDLAAALDAGEDLFTLEQQVRRSDPATADLMVVHRSAIRADGARALLQRMGRASGPTWLEPLLPEAIVGQPLWGHDGAIASMWVDGAHLVTRGQVDGRLRRFAADGICHLDREATPLDEARRLGEHLVVVVGEGRGAAVELRDPDTGELRETVALPSSDGYEWVETARVLETGMVGLEVGEDYPGSLYGAQYRWFRFDPRTQTRESMPAPSEVVSFAGRVAAPQADGTIRLVEDAAQLQVRHAHGWSVGAVALAGERFVSGSDDGIRIHDRDGELLARGTERHRGLAQIVIADPIVTTSRYIHQSPGPAPHARLWDPVTAEAGRRVDAGDRYQELMSCDPTGSRVVYTDDGVLYLCELGERRRGEPKPLRLTWHYNRRIAWSADGLRLAVQHHGHAPTVWELETGERERILTTDVLDSAHFGISEDGEVVTVDHSFYCLRSIRVDDGEALQVVKPGFTVSCSASRGTKGVCGGVEGGFWFDRATNRRVQHKRGAWIHACHVAGPLAALAGSDGVYAIELETGELLWRWAPEVEQVQVAVIDGYVVSLDAGGLLTTLRDGEVEMQRMATPVSADTWCSMCPLPDRSVLVACPDGWIRRWDVITGDLVDDYAIGEGGLHSLSYGGGKVVVWRGTESRSREWVGFRLADRAPISLPAGAEKPRLTPDGRRVISLDAVARLDVLDARTAEVLEHRPFGTWARAEQLAFVDGEVRGCGAQPISDGVHEVEARADGTIEVRRVGEREPIARWVAPRKWTCVAIDGDRVAAGDAAGDLALWALRHEDPA